MDLVSLFVAAAFGALVCVYVGTLGVIAIERKDSGKEKTMKHKLMLTRSGSKKAIKEGETIMKGLSDGIEDGKYKTRFHKMLGLESPSYLEPIDLGWVNEANKRLDERLNSEIDEIVFGDLNEKLDSELDEIIFGDKKG